ncbi:NTP transferase domain-containing protein [Rhizobiales bacterium TNE-4]|nr:NTP transferase domain-containing protein [Rhizobiales bacterium TNE-4]MBV1828603.1 NTP transferase domain-containing protein [Rhizobiales bacterium TNE-4]
MSEVGSEKQLTVIIQAGGRGSRLRHHTWNKPKCLVSVRGKPLLYHIFDHFEKANFIVIGDYLFDQIVRYIEVNPINKKLKLVKAKHKGTLSGLQEALGDVDKLSPVLFIWGDIIVHNLPDLSVIRNTTVFTTSAFPCRWSVDTDGIINEIPSSISGIPGIFYFPTPSFLYDAPDSGEFVRWLAQTKTRFDFLAANEIEELGDFARIENEATLNSFSRFFNKVEILDDVVIKTVINNEYFEIHENEKQWYKDVAKLGYRRMPRIFNDNPLIMERLPGKHLFEINDLTPREKRLVLYDYFCALSELHEKASKPSIFEDVKNVYFDKTLARISSVAELIPFASKRFLTVNGLKCCNFFHPDFQHVFRDILPQVVPENFTPIHGDPTFSNSFIDDNLRVKFIDPRGYFYKAGIYGDPGYDFAKFYYSAVGGYDAFNRRKFKLFIDEETAEVLLEEPAFSSVSDELFSDFLGNDFDRIKIIHALIWFSFTGYARDDVDSVIGAFALGTYWLQRALNNT